MIFYQATVNDVLSDMLIDAFLLNCKKPEFLHFNVFGYPDAKTLEDFIEIVEEKRKALDNPYGHEFLCLELNHHDEVDPQKIIENSDKAAHAFFNEFKQDVYVSSLVYKDDDNKLIALVILSNIEKSLPRTTQHWIRDKEIFRIIMHSMPNYEVDHYMLYYALYAFNGKDLPYAGVTHVNATIYKE